MMDRFILRNVSVDKMENDYKSIVKRKMNPEYSSDYMEMIQNTTNFNCCLDGDKLAFIKKETPLKKKQEKESPKSKGSPPSEKKSSCSKTHDLGAEHLHENEVQSIRRGKMP